MNDQNAREKVLVVDDDPMSVMLLGRVLKDASCDIATAASGEEALTHTEELHLVLLDISLPGIDGYEVAQEIRARDSSRNIPIIFISSHSNPVDKARAFNAGAVDYIEKPFDFEEVRLRVDSQLRLARLQREIQSRNQELLERNQELERFVQTIQEKESQLSDSERRILDSRQRLSESQRSLDRIFTALSEVLPGTVLDKRYRLDSIIGTGGFGAVYRATHLVLDRPIAVKVLQPPRGEDADEQLARFKTEAMSAYRFNHPNAVSVLDASVSSSGLPYIVMELLEGWSLREEISNSGKLSLKRCAEIMVPVCDVISRAHKVGITHRDIKPDNIFIDLEDESETIKVLDFGLAKMHRDVSEPFAGTGGDRVIVGTPAYMAPEAFKGDESAPEKIDVYAIAAVTFEALTGQLPFPPGPGGVAAIITQHLTAERPRLGDFLQTCSMMVQSLIMAGMELKPDIRPTVRAFGEQLIIATLTEGSEPLSEEEAATLRLKPLDED